VASSGGTEKRYDLVWSLVAPSGQKVALAARRRRQGGVGQQPFLALDGDPAQEHYWDARIFEDLHVAVYRAGFVATQELYDQAAGRVHRFLADLEEHLHKSTYVHGDRPTVSDLWLFSLLVRFDQVYGPGFRLHRYRIRDLPATQHYLRRLYAIPACTATTDFAAISAGYFLGIPALNRNVVPAGPDELYLRDEGTSGPWRRHPSGARAAASGAIPAAVHSDEEVRAWGQTVVVRHREVWLTVAGGDEVVAASNVQSNRLTTPLGPTTRCCGSTSRSVSRPPTSV
jgi:hypothetical protein